jgi:hypothetical protein
MRGQRAALVAVLLAAVAALGGCGSAPTVGDGVLDAAWAVMPKPVVPAPKADACTVGGGGQQVDWDLSLFRFNPVDCAAPHESETYFLGTLTAEASVSLPEVGDDLFREAYGTCAKEADAFLGGDYRTARVQVVPVLPTERQWTGAARFYRCEMLQVADTNLTITRRSGSLRDGLKNGSAAIGCGNQKLTSDKKFIEVMTFVGCTEAHDMELTGVYTAPDGPFPGHESLHNSSSQGCLGVSAAYLGMSKSALNATGGISWVAWGGYEDTWSAGDRSFWCFLGPYPDRKMHSSLKGKRPGNFPR